MDDEDAREGTFVIGGAWSQRVSTGKYAQAPASARVLYKSGCVSCGAHGLMMLALLAIFCAPLHTRAAHLYKDLCVHLIDIQVTGDIKVADTPHLCTWHLTSAHDTLLSAQTRAHTHTHSHIHNVGHGATLLPQDPQDPQDAPPDELSCTVILTSMGRSIQLAASALEKLACAARDNANRSRDASKSALEEASQGGGKQAGGQGGGGGGAGGQGQQPAVAGGTGTSSSPSNYVPASVQTELPNALKALRIAEMATGAAKVRVCDCVCMRMGVGLHALNDVVCLRWFAMMGAWAA
eukprot:1162036-Pelagomonas_calceolata.AAC.10